jgi:hypothetical protein
MVFGPAKTAQISKKKQQKSSIIWINNTLIHLKCREIMVIMVSSREVVVQGEAVVNNRELLDKRIWRNHQDR